MQIHNNTLIAECSSYDFKEMLERKKVKSWLKSVSAFANTDGGSLFYGVNDDGVIVGLENPQADADFISEMIKARLDPVPEVQLIPIEHEGRTLLEVRVKAGTLTPYYYYQDGTRTAYTRVGNESVECNSQQLLSLVLKGTHMTWDSLPTQVDAKEKKYIDECGAANFFGIKNNTYITPKSSSILPSITNKSLMQLAEDMGIKVECRPVPEEELETFEEAGACGTAAVISPIQRIDDLENNKSYVISKDGKPGPICTKLYTKLRAIQYGDEPDTHNWVTILD